MLELRPDAAVTKPMIGIGDARTVDPSRPISGTVMALAFSIRFMPFRRTRRGG